MRDDTHQTAGWKNNSVSAAVCNQVHGIVTSTDMGQLVREKRFDLTRRQVAQDRDGQQDHRPQEPHDARSIHESRFHDPERDVQSKPGGKPFAGRLPRRHRFGA